MAYLKRVLNPIRKIKFVYITNTYKALLRDKSIIKNRIFFGKASINTIFGKNSISKSGFEGTYVNKKTT